MSADDALRGVAAFEGFGHIGGDDLAIGSVFGGVEWFEFSAHFDFLSRG